MDSPFLGMVQYFAFDFTPRGYLNCNGALLSIAANAALFSLLGTQYGGNGTSTFALPDLRGRSVTGQGSSWFMGEVFGTENVTMLTTNMPAHTHTATSQIAANNTVGSVTNPTNIYPAGAHPGRGTAKMYTATPDSGAFLGAPSVTIATAGSNTPFNIRNPYLAVTACIASLGIFPSRN